MPKKKYPLNGYPVPEYSREKLEAMAGDSKYRLRPESRNDWMARIREDAGYVQSPEEEDRLLQLLSQIPTTEDAPSEVPGQLSMFANDDLLGQLPVDAGTSPTPATVSGPTVATSGPTVATSGPTVAMPEILPNSSVPEEFKQPEELESSMSYIREELPYVTFDDYDRWEENLDWLNYLYGKAIKDRHEGLGMRIPYYGPIPQTIKPALPQATGFLKNASSKIPTLMTDKAGLANLFKKLT